MQVLCRAGQVVDQLVAAGQEPLLVEREQEPLLVERELRLAVERGFAERGQQAAERELQLAVAQGQQVLARQSRFAREQFRAE